MTNRAIQDFYPDEVAICYGCGRHNDHGLHVKTYWNSATKEGICRFTPQDYHTAFPGYVYGGLAASLIDCHAMATATAAVYDAQGREPGTEPEITHVTGNLNVSFLKPTPMGVELLLRARATEIHRRKTIVTCSLYARDDERVKAEIIAIRMKSRFIE